jgi:hypothetical protein
MMQIRSIGTMQYQYFRSQRKRCACAASSELTESTEDSRSVTQSCNGHGTIMRVKIYRLPYDFE